MPFHSASRNTEPVYNRFGNGEKPDVAACLGVLLDHVDYTKGACGPTEMVSAVIPAEVLQKARESLGWKA